MMLRDFLRAFRTWGRTPRLTLAIVLCIAVAIGGASTVLTFVYSLLWRPLPFPDASRLVLVKPKSVNGSPGSRPYLSYPDFSDLRAAATSFEAIDAALVSRLVIVTESGAERLRGEVVTPGYFSLFGLTPQVGRVFTEAEYAGRGERAILISSRLWRSHFAAEEEIVGRAVQTRAGPAVVIGVMSEGYLGVAEDEGTDYWLAEGQTNHPSLLTSRSEPTALVFARLKSGVDIAGAEAEVTALLTRIARQNAATTREPGATLVSFGEKWRADLRPGLVVMLVASLFLLGIGSGNVAILLLARLVSREREIAVRLSMGATRKDLMRLLGAEGAVLALLGGGLGVGLSIGLGEMFRAVGGLALPTHLPVVFGIAPLALSAGVVLLTGTAFTLVPALVAARVDSAAALRTGGRGVAASALQGGAGRLLVIGQTALAVVLLSGAALFIRSYDKLRFLDLGFRTEGLLRYQVSLQRETYPTGEAMDAFFRRLALDLRAIPGVRGIGYLAPTLPPYDANEIEVRLPGGAALEDRFRSNQHFATNEAFEILGVRLSEGRLFGPQDRRGGAPVALVSRTFARRVSPTGSALGRVVTLPDGLQATIVGVVADARWNGQRNRRPSGLNIFLSLDQFPQASVGVLFDAAVNPRSLIDPVRRVVVARDPAAALHWIDTMDEALDFQTVSERFWTLLTAAYATTAFLLAALGLYGILSHGVASRVREIGVRLALGATSGAVARFVALQGLRLVGTGLGAGLLLALLLGRLIESRLYETSSADPLALAAVAASLLAVSALTAWLPARRAARVSPLTALRSE
ncbi:MAG: ADOP family duplicated permease [Vicinamibacteria bacterium]|nr:ADOP family duplicated permease [Vicinamibacteria bacterium]